MTEKYSEKTPDPVACETTPSGPQSRYAAEWGLASLILGGVQVLAAILVFVLILWYLGLVGPLRPGRSAVRLAAIISGTLAILFWLTTFFSIGMGVVGVRAAWQRCQPGGLPLAGLTLSILAFLLWTAVGLSLIMSMVDLSQQGFM